MVYEVKNNITFTYAAVKSIVDSAKQYITEGVMPDKAIDLLVEIAPSMAKQGQKQVTKTMVEEYVSTKTGIPAGPIKSKERDLLMNLEDVLHERVIGQHKAIKALSSAMRRARAGIGSKDKPMGTFLFLGPTGVGKTETAKALTRVIFGDEGKMSRLDMSEFNGEEGLGRLIGKDGSAGLFANMLREHPYGVVLLDEFEKTTSEVHDLFLQVFDEGVFTDARGKKVSARK